MEKIVAATNNAGKLREIREILDGIYEVVSLKDLRLNVDAEETGATFEENALIKARAVFLAANLPALADDSGLCVDALDGAPGVYSARYSGENASDKENNALLLKNMEGISDRDAKFVSAVVLYRGENDYITATGETAGRILLSPEGSGGFGYDCLFFSAALGKSFGLATAEEKNSVSHRAAALRALTQKLAAKI